MEQLFVAASIRGSPCKNDNLVFSFKIILSVIMTNQGPSLWGDGGNMSPQLLDRGDIISFVSPNILWWKVM